MTLDTKTIKRLWAYVRPYWPLELLTLLDMAVLAGLALAVPLAVKYMIDDLIPSLVASGPGASIMPVIYFALVLLGIHLAQIIFSWIRDYLAGYIGANIIADFRSQLFGHLERLSISFFQHHQVGEVMSRLLSDVNRIQSLLILQVLMFCTNVLMLTAIAIYLLSTNPVLTLIALIPVPLTIWLTGKFGKKLHDIARRLQESIARFSARIQESFLSIKTIKAFGREDGEQEKVEVILKGMTRLYISNSVANSLAVNVINFINMAGPIVVLSWGTYLIAGGTMKLGTLIAFYMLLSYLYSPIQGLASVHIEVQSAMASVNRLFEYLDIEPDIKEDENPVTIERVKGEIRLEDVTFRYKGNGFSLENFSLTVSEKEKIAIVGPSGSGKTTITYLIMRLFDPQDGTVTIDGTNLKKISIESLRRNISLVEQDPMLFKTSIFDNIAFSSPDASLDEVMESARAANIHDFIMSLPDKYNTEVGERGVTLSGGEKQRICLARAI